jgi:hypothetical protein
MSKTKSAAPAAPKAETQPDPQAADVGTTGEQQASTEEVSPEVAAMRLAVQFVETGDVSTLADFPVPPPSAEPAIVITPTVGRRVWYWPFQPELAIRSDPPMTQIDPAQPMDAGIVFVHDDRRVNLVVTDHMGNVHPRTGVQLAQSGDVVSDSGGWCEWVPHQKAKA